MNLIKNIQFQQLINLLLLLLIASLNNSLQASWGYIFILAAYSAFLEAIISYKFENKIYFPYSAIITSFGIILMVGFLKWYIPFVVVTLAILQKKFIKIDGKHIFNPSNFALILAIALFYPKASPIIGQLGVKGWYIIYFVIFIATLILIRVNRVAISVSFIAFYILLEYLIIKPTNPLWSLDEFLNSFFSTSFIVYIFFMLTDPITTPNSLAKQIFFGFFVALITVALDYFVGEHLRNLFLSLYLTSVIFIPIYRNKIDKKYIIILMFSFAISLYILTLKPLFFSM